MAIEPRFRAQVKALILKDRRAKALNDALSPTDRLTFNSYVLAVIAVLLFSRFRNGATVEDIARFGDEVAASHRKEMRPVNEFVIDEILRLIYGRPLVFQSIPVPPSAVSAAGAAVVRHLNNNDPSIAQEVDEYLDAAEELYTRAYQ